MKKLSGRICYFLTSLCFIACLCLPFYHADASQPEPDSSTVISLAKNDSKKTQNSKKDVHSLEDIPAFSGDPFIEINENIPLFSEEDLTTKSYESYSDLDEEERCGTAVACIGQDLMPSEERGPIGSIKPSGWHTVKYNDLIDSNYLYNRCHLIGYQLSGENANEKNLITGTRYLNTEGMLPFENMVADYVDETDNHVLYRVTPVFEGDNLVASGVFMEAESVEDEGEGILFHVFCYNAQPGITIDYATGDSKASETTEENSSKDTKDEKQEYAVNTNTGKFHYPSCSSADTIKSENRMDYTGTREELISQGYEPCKRCKP